MCMSILYTCMSIHDMGVHAVSMWARRRVLDPLELELDGWELTWVLLLFVCF